MADRDPLDKLPGNVRALLERAGEPRAVALVVVTETQAVWEQFHKTGARPDLARAVLDLADAIVPAPPDPDPRIEAFLAPLRHKPWLPLPSDVPGAWERERSAMMAVDSRELDWLRRAVAELQAEIMRRDRVEARRPVAPDHLEEDQAEWDEKQRW